MRIGFLPRIACLTAIVALASVSVQAQELFNRESRKEAGSFSGEQQDALLARRTLIREEVSNSAADEWAGTYGYEDSPTSGALLDWAHANGFVVSWSTCSHGWRDKANFGSVDFRDGILRVTPELG